MLLIDLALAALPIVLVAVLLACRLEPIPVVIGVIAATLVLSFRFPLTWDAIESTGGRLLPITLAVSLIILGGVLLAETLAASGAQTRIGAWLEAAAQGRERALLLIGLTIGPLAESLIGWGIGIIVAAPLLIQIGLSATRAATIALLGMVVAPWGSLAPGLLVSSQLGGEDFREVGIWTALFNLPVLLVMAATIAIVGMGWRVAVRRSPEVLSTALVMWLVLLASNLWISVPLSGALSSLAGAAWLLVLARIRGGGMPAMDRATTRSLLPYALLVTSLLSMTAFTSLVPLGAASAVLTSPALWLLVTAVVTPALLGLDREGATTGLVRGLRLFVPVWLVTVLFIVLGALLAANGMAETLSDGAAMLGTGFLLVVPLMGFLGGYTTASNTAIASMFSAGISHVSLAIDASPAMVLGSQNASGGAAVISSPARVALASAIANDNRVSGTERADVRFAMVAVLAANAVILVILSPITFLLGGVA
ncbi:L-lactate permease [Salinibacterium sp. SYSU T00001]|uniref:L-lactate permease n=1 Tax=Homoserinimonas sedimenticola TaxID=2986805 RepID=UPI002236AA5F|nr:L-lactate permease [Salinibacterium sedimenticola]MCW4385473.1 L-lactate permease [Salinibacterium sedimenticola]